MTKTKKHHKVLPTKQFRVPVTIPFPTDEQAAKLIEWLRLYSNDKKYLARIINLCRPREYTFVFEIDAEGEWKFIGRKA